jgi:serine/threonine-protein kinase HipA
VAELIVWLGSKVVGELGSTGRRSASFRPARPGIGLTIGAPDDGSTWTPEFTRAWFENLLPEEEPRSRIAARFGLRSDDTWGLLEQIGWECAGAVAVLPPGVTPRSGSYEPLTVDGFWSRLAELPARPYDRDAAVRMSLGGGQNKLLLARRQDGWEMPIDGAPSTHILKPEPAYHPGLAMAEAWSLAVAAAATRAAEVAVIAREGNLPVLSVTRFDRTVADDGSVIRAHQEDFCQVLGLAPEIKYASHPVNPRLPSYRRIAAALERRASDPPAELLRLLEQTTVNLAMGNTDAHAKNHSVFHAPAGDVSLTPIYDVAPTRAFIDQRHLALPVAGRFAIADITRDHLVRESVTWGIPERAATVTVTRVLDAMMEEGLRAGDSTFPSLDPRIRGVAVASMTRLALS